MSPAERQDRIATLERIIGQAKDPKFAGLIELWHAIAALPEPWVFPSEHAVAGFAGLAPILVVGEQPSRGPWTPQDRGRRLLYDVLQSSGAAEAHLTDIIKSRGGPSEWRSWTLERCQPHIDILQRELDLLNPKPKSVILLGENAYELFSAHFPKYAKYAQKVAHFGYARRGDHQSLRVREELSHALAIAMSNAEPGPLP